MADNSDRIAVIPRNPNTHPMRWTPECAHRIDPTSSHMVAVWMTLRTAYSPGTAIPVDELHGQYLEDFASFEQRTGLLGEAEFLRILSEAARAAVAAAAAGTGVMAFSLQAFEGRALVVSANWATVKDTEAMAGRVGVQLDLVYDAETERRPPPSNRLEGDGGRDSVVAPGVVAETSDGTETATCDPAVTDADGKYRVWLSDVLVSDENCAVGAGDVWTAFKHKFTEDGSDEFESETRPLIIEQLLRLVLECFPHISLRKAHGVHNIQRLRWKRLPQGVKLSRSVHNTAKGFPEWMREDAHWLLYLKLQCRVCSWQFMYLEQKRNHTVSVRTLYRMYLLAFARSAETHHRVQEEGFLRILKTTFPGVQEMMVSENHVVLLNLSTRDEAISPQALLKCAREVEFNRLVRPDRGTASTTPQNLFAQRLAEKPLLALPSRRHSDEFALPFRPAEERMLDGAAAPGPFIQRLRRRGQGLPLGDEEPGFPGVSLKRESRRLRRRIEVYRDAAARTLEGDPTQLFG